MVRMAGWAISVRVRRSAGPSKMISLSAKPRAASASSKVARHTGKLLDQAAAHADRLGALPGKDEGDHRGDTIAPATCCSTRSRTPSATIREAVTTALRIALADERPWQTCTSPATPSSGAPPYSE